MAFTDELLLAFQSGLPVPHPQGGTWFATLDSMAPDNADVACVVRLSRSRPVTPSPVQLKSPSFGERERKLFAEPLPECLSRDADLLLAYTFVPLLSAQENVRLFVEFGGMELSRLR